MHVDGLKAVAGALVGFTVGLTGMGGGALMTPILILVFGVNPGTAVSSDLLASLVMKPVGATVHFRRGTVNWSMARWLALGSVPAAAAGVFVLNRLNAGSPGAPGSGGHVTGARVAGDVNTLLGWVLVVAAVSMVAKAFLGSRARTRSAPPAHDPLVVKRAATLLIGVVGGFVVGLTSVGSGSLMIASLMLLYPRLSARQMVGTDIVQAIPLVASATLSHALFGHIDLGLTTSLLVGSLPGVYLGARVSSRAPDAVIRPALVLILLGSALKLLGLGNAALGETLLILGVVGLPLWGATDASTRPEHQWTDAGHRRTFWVTAQVITAPFLVGCAVTLAYLAVVRPRLVSRDPLATETAANLPPGRLPPSSPPSSEGGSGERSGERDVELAEDVVADGVGASEERAGRHA